MFGYVIPDKPELKIREYRTFNAYYCAICKSIGKRWGQIPRVTLYYDSAFLAVLLSSLTDSEIKIADETCIAHPIKKRPVLKTDKKIIDYAADMNLLLAYYKMDDNVYDEKSLLSATGKLFLKKAAKKIKASYPEKCAIIEEKLKQQRMLEKDNCVSMDLASEPFAGLMEEIMSFDNGNTDDKRIRILRWIGFNLGKWIYILDAFDDLEKDIKSGQYNCLVYQLGFDGTDAKEFKRSIRDRVEFNLTQALYQISSSMELLDIKKNKGILDNVAYLGLLAKSDQILNGTGSCKKFEKSI